MSDETLTTTPEPTPSPSPTPETSPTPSPIETQSTTSEAPADTSLLNQPEPEAKPEAPVVPEAYELKPSEGHEISPELLAEATPILKELGVTQEGAQKLADFFAKQSSAAIEKLFNDQRATRQEWATEAKTFLDSQPGGSKQVKADIASAKNALFANPDGTPNAEKIGKFNQFMDMTGAGDNPLFIEAFTKMAKFYTEGKPVTGGNPSPLGQRGPDSGRPSRAAALYPNLTGQPQSG